MSDLIDRMELIKTELAAYLPDRVITRDFMDITQRKESDLSSGIFTILSDGEGEYANYATREGMDGRQALMIIGQFELPESVIKDTPSAIENAEFVMVEEIKSFLRQRPPLLAQMFMKNFRQSLQMDAPYGWVSIKLEFLQ
jgi:hypothetical protein